MVPERRKFYKTHLKKPFHKKSIPAITALLLAILLTISSAAAPKKSYNRQEQQVLSSFPKLSFHSWISGEFTESVEQYLQDHVLLKGSSMKWVNRIQVALGNHEIDNVYILENRLIEKIPMQDQRIAKSNTQIISDFFDTYGTVTPCYFGLIPTACEVYQELLPNHQILNQQKLIGELYQSFPDNYCIDILTTLNARKTDRLYYYSDNRWTSAGAYAGYQAICQSMGETPFPEDNFNIEHAYYDYYGNLYQRTYLKPPISDTIDLYHYNKTSPIQEVEKIVNGESEIYSSIFFRDMLESNSPQSVFLGYSSPITKIRTNLQNHKRLLLFSDNYASALMQFLPLHYEEIVFVDLSTISPQELKQISVEEFESVLFLYNVKDYLSDSTIGSKIQLLLN